MRISTAVSKLGIMAVLTLLTLPAQAISREKVLHVFSGSDGSAPNGSVIFDKAGNLYGTTSAGGAGGFGTVFKLTPGENGTWTQTVLHEFNRDGTDGANPEGTLIFDNAGNLYGTTSNGGSDQNGAIFELLPQADGSWTETILYSLHGTDGSHPYGSLTFDAQGNLYGTAYQGGYSLKKCIYGGCGTVFKLSAGSNGEWTETTIHIFHGDDGSNPFCNVVFDAQGNLYGTTVGYASNYFGTVFRLTPVPSGQWPETVITKFNDPGGDQLYSGLIFDKAGSLYGTTWSGGAHAAGSVFKLTPGQNGKWTKTTLHSFNGKDGSFVYAGVVFDAAGSLWGTTAGYGSDLGSVYKLSPGSSGQWTITVLRTFTDIQVNGGVVFDATGNVYSTTLQGGSGSTCNEGCGQVFELTP
jgi:uncharacterized repeat protein (TIGR03803 family)